MVFKISDIQMLMRMTNELKCSHLQVYNLWPDSITFFFLQRFCRETRSDQTRNQKLAKSFYYRFYLSFFYMNLYNLFILIYIKICPEFKYLHNIFLDLDFG